MHLGKSAIDAIHECATNRAEVISHCIAGGDGVGFRKGGEQV